MKFGFQVGFHHKQSGETIFGVTLRVKGAQRDRQVPFQCSVVCAAVEVCALLPVLA
jgi:hypothetical protein